MILSSPFVTSLTHVTLIQGGDLTLPLSNDAYLCMIMSVHLHRLIWQPEAMAGLVLYAVHDLVNGLCFQIMLVLKA